MHIGFSSFEAYTQSGVFFLVYLGQIVCVCTHHQNMKLILTQLGVSHTELYEFLACDINSKEPVIQIALRTLNC